MWRCERWFYCILLVVKYVDVEHIPANIRTCINPDAPEVAKLIRYKTSSNTSSYYNIILHFF